MTQQEQIKALIEELTEMALISVDGYLITAGDEWDNLSVREQTAAQLGVAAGITVTLRILIDRGLDVTVGHRL